MFFLPKVSTGQVFEVLKQVVNLILEPFILQI